MGRKIDALLLFAVLVIFSFSLANVNLSVCSGG